MRRGLSMHSINDHDGLDTMLIIACSYTVLSNLFNFTNLNKARETANLHALVKLHISIGISNNFIKVSNYQNLIVHVFEIHRKISNRAYEMYCLNTYEKSKMKSIISKSIQGFCS